MHQLQINVGAVDNVIPLLENCLKADAGKFYSTQNAVRLHEWIRDVSLTPPVLESKVASADGTFQLRTLGHVDKALYPERWYPGQLLKIEQVVIALPNIASMVARINATASNGDTEAYSATLSRLMEKVDVITAFSANAMFLGTAVPRRFSMEDLDVLDILVTMILTQRNKILYQTTEVSKVGFLPTMYNQLELDKVISRCHNAVLEGYYPNPATQYKADGMLDESFYRQCAMAYSAACAVPIPRAYIESEPTQVFHWAFKMLNDLKTRLPSFQARPTIRAVTPI